MEPKTLILYHSADLDGVLSGVIAYYYLSRRRDNIVDKIGVDYGEEKIKQINYSDYDEIYVIDFSDEWLLTSEHSNKIILIDHHRTCIEKNYHVRKYCIEGVAACRLSLQFFTNLDHMLLNKEDFVERRVNEPLFVTLAGEYDIWDTQSRYSRFLNFGIFSVLSFDYVSFIFESTKQKLTKITPKELIKDKKKLEEFIEKNDSEILNSSDLFRRIIDNGEGVLSYIQRTENILDGVNVKLSGLNGVCFNTHIRSSLIYRLKRDEDFTMVWCYEGGEKVKVSMYSDKKDLHEIAKAFGGGGHPRACGFRLNTNSLINLLNGKDILAK